LFSTASATPIVRRSREKEEKKEKDPGAKKIPPLIAEGKPTAISLSDLFLAYKTVKYYLRGKGGGGKKKAPQHKEAYAAASRAVAAAHL